MSDRPQRISETRIIANRAYGSDVTHAIDPICGRETDPNQEVSERVELNGRTYYFCSVQCRAEFEMHPERHVALDIFR